MNQPLFTLLRRRGTEAEEGGQNRSRFVRTAARGDWPTEVGARAGRLRDCTVHHSRDRRGALALADGLVTGCLAARADTLDEVCSPKMQWWSLLALADLFVINRPHTH